MEIEISESEARYMLGKLSEDMEYYGLLVQSSKCSIGNREGYELVAELVGKLELGIEEERRERISDMPKKSGSIERGSKGGYGPGPGEKKRSVRVPLHEGAAGSGSVVKSKFHKESRDEAGGEKEPGKSRGAGGN